MMRLDKILADMGVGTRSQVKKLIRDGAVRVNGEIVSDPRINFNPEASDILIHEEPLVYQKFFYYMLNKPSGTLCVANSPHTVMNLIHEPIKGLFPVGRLDKDTEGLLLIMNDGNLCHELLSPKQHVDKVYYVQLRDPLNEETIQRIEAGIVEEGGDAFLPGKVKACSSSSCRLTIHEGKYHEVKRMFEACNNKVTYLKREQFGDVVLDPSLKPGQYRALTEAEVNSLRFRQQKEQ
ncbi:MAG: pseudouridine synthase [Bulleidia sp.]|nr:pseudouridine synthase [Bulleidia sp.]